MVNERKLYPEIEHTLEHWGAYWAKMQDFRFINKNGEVASEAEAAAAEAPEEGKTDFVAVWPSKIGALIEVKHTPPARTGACNFAVSEIRPGQRVTMDKFPSISWLWLSFGGRIGGKENPRTVFLVNWPYWKATVEDTLKSFDLAGLAYIQPHKLEHREAGLSARCLLQNWQLVYDAATKTWSLPASHPFSFYLAA